MHRRLRLQWLAQVVAAVEVEAALPVLPVVVDAVVQPLKVLLQQVAVAEVEAELRVVHPLEPPAAVAVVVPLLKVLPQQVPAEEAEAELPVVVGDAVVRRLLRLDHARLPTVCL